MKTKEELNELRNEVESMNMKLSELTDEELNEIVGGMNIVIDDMPKFLSFFLRLFHIK